MRVKSPVFNVEAGVFFEPFSLALNPTWFRARPELNMVRSQQNFLDPFNGGKEVFYETFRFHLFFFISVRVITVSFFCPGKGGDP
jgi:hypothetical protein